MTGQSTATAIFVDEEEVKTDTDAIAKSVREGDISSVQNECIGG